MSKAKPPTPKKPATQPEKGEPIPVKKDHVVVRMYCTGLGDCFLLAFPGDDGKTKYVMIDCGVFRGTFQAKQWVTRIMQHIRGTVGKEGLEVLVITHQHWDHISGFKQAADVFKQIPVKQVWMPWTEEPGNPVAMAIKARQRMMVRAIGAAAQRMRGAGFGLGEMADGVAHVMGFMGVASEQDVADEQNGCEPEGGDADHSAAAPASVLGAAEFLGASKQMEDLMSGIADRASGEAKYPRPSLTPTRIEGVPGVNVYVLGPPTDEAMLKKDDPSAGDKSEVYLGLGLGLGSAAALAAEGEVAGAGAGQPPSAEAALFAAASVGPASRGSMRPDDLDDNAYVRERSQPFDQEYRIPADSPNDQRCVERYGRHCIDRYAEFFERHYGKVVAAAGGEEVVAPRETGKDDWRRIDTDWLSSVSQLALDLDDHVNNTSLVLAFELGDSDDAPVLLFPGDAQVGNWLSWHQLEPPHSRGDGGGRRDRRTVAAADLLKRTVLYKVGHHASHNATLKALGLKLMSRQARLTALVPVDYREAHKPKGGNEDGWDMPYGKLLQDLISRTHGKVILADEGIVPARGNAPKHWKRELRDHFEKGWAEAVDSGWDEAKWMQFQREERVRIEKRSAKIKNKDEDVERPFFVQLTVGRTTGP
jgi:hypothetical protein